MVLLGKPAPAIYEVAMQMLEVENPKEVLAIGDSMEHDIAGHLHSTQVGHTATLKQGRNMHHTLLIASCASSLEESMSTPMTQNACVAVSTDSVTAPVCGSINEHDGL